jgi:hypothetical protein
MKSTQYGRTVAVAVAGIFAMTMSAANAREAQGTNDGRSSVDAVQSAEVSAARIQNLKDQAGLINQISNKFKIEAAGQYRGDFNAIDWKLAFGSRLFHQSASALATALSAGTLQDMQAGLASAVAAKHVGGIPTTVTMLDNPCRIVDTRLGGGSLLGPAFRFWFASNTPAVIAGQGGNAAGCGTYPGAEGFILYVTAVPQGAPLSGGAGFLTVQHDATGPTTSTLNYYPGINVADFAIVACNGCGSTTGGFNAFASNPTHVVIDLVGIIGPLPPAGRAAAYVTTTATFDATRTRNFSAVSRPSTGVYCLTPSSSIDPNTSVLMVSIDWSNSLGSTLAAYHRTSAVSGGCAATDFSVRTYDFASNPTNNVAFEVLVP